ncbi:ABC transporter permease [Agromyces atrinae]|uniref:ABC transporter permease n=1 Tax=Agromyces atrinae TaxID=592376 RepID=A0A4Q2MBB9_9MICO|nr:ABC transporter permease [Agromyces atrinae]NYD68089.1 peptide/nickel transport system permease protein [Agromyces atrinae]RXZ87763.1 ABC transporter permease [Agromyces atrinae]
MTDPKATEAHEEAVAEEIEAVAVPGQTQQAAVAARSPLQLVWARLRRDPTAMISAAVILLVIIAALAAPLVASLIGHGPNEQFRDDGLTEFGTPVGPNSQFLLGTDNLGRDVLVRLVYGAQISLIVAFAATLGALGIGTLVGLVAGFMRGWVDTVLTWLMDTTLSLPQLLFAISLVALVGPSLGTTVIVIVLFSWAPIARVVRGQVLSLREREFVEAARSLGASNWRIMRVDVLPNLLVPILVYGTLLIPQAIVFEATLSFLGLGVLPPTATWGNMLSVASTGSLYTIAPWLVIFPSAALLAVTLAFNLLGDSIRDALDPRQTLFAGRRRLARNRAAKRAARRKASA